MKFSISKELFLAKLATVANALPVKSPMPQLQGVKIDLDSAGMTLTASDGNISLKTEIGIKDGHLSVEDNGNVLVSGKMLLNIVRAVSAKEINVETKENAVEITAGKGIYKLALMDLANYPKFDFGENVEESQILGVIEMESDKFKDLVDDVIISASTSEKKPILTGVNFSVNKGELTLNATDAFRLSRRVAKLENEDTFSTTIPSEYLNKIKAFATGKMTIVFLNTRAIVITDDVKAIIKLLDGVYPDTSKLVPQSYMLNVEFNRNELLNAVDRIIILAPTDNQKDKETTLNVVRFKGTKDSNEVVVSVLNGGIGSAKEYVASTYPLKEDISLAFNGKYFLDAIKSFKSEVISMNITSDIRPFTLTSQQEENKVQLLLPVRLSD